MNIAEVHVQQTYRRLNQVVNKE